MSAVRNSFDHSLFGFAIQKNVEHRFQRYSIGSFSAPSTINVQRLDVKRSAFVFYLKYTFSKGSEPDSRRELEKRTLGETFLGCFLESPLRYFLESLRESL